MFRERLKIFYNMGLILVMVKGLSFLKMYLIGKYYGFTQEIDYFFFFSGIVLSIFYFYDSVLQAAFIPEYKRFKKGSRSYPYTFIFLFLMFNLLIASGIVFSSVIDVHGELIEFSIIFFMLSSVIFKVILEAEGHFVKNILVDLISVLIFLFLLIKGKTILKVLFVSEAVRFGAKLLLNSKYFTTNNNFRIEGFKNFFKQAWFITLGAFFSNAIIFFDNVMAAKLFAGPSILSYAMMFPGAAIAFINALLSGVNLNVMSELIRKHRLRDAGRWLKTVIYRTIKPAIFFAMFFTIFSREVMNTFFHSNKDLFAAEITNTWHIMSLAAWHIPIFLILINLIRFYNSREKNQELAIVAFFNLMMHIAIVKLLLNDLGLISILFARVFCDSFSTFILWYRMREFKVEKAIPVRFLLHSLIAGLSSGSIKYFLLKSSVSDINIMISGIVLFGIYYLMITGKEHVRIFRKNI